MPFVSQKLSVAEVRKILQLHHKEGVSVDILSLLYPVSVSTIYDILSGRSRWQSDFDYSRFSMNKPPHNTKRTAEAIVIAKEMRANGASLRDIAAEFGVTKATACIWCKIEE